MTMTASFVRRALTGLLQGRLRIGTVATISSTALDLPDLLAGFHLAHPGVDIALQEGTTAELIAGIGDGVLDAAFIGLGTIRHAREITTAELVRERLVAVTVAHGTVPRQGTGLRERLDAAFAAAGVRPRIAFESGEPHLLVRLAGAGLGTALVPESVVLRHPDDRLASAVLSPRIDGRIGVAWHRDRPLSPAAHAFVAHVHGVTP